MTRFARAKGSKSSNEKVPEEATSWAEMKQSILSKKSSKPEEFKPKEETKSSPPKQTEWASFEDNCDNSLLNQTSGTKSNNLDNYNNNGNSLSNRKIKRKKEKNIGDAINEKKELKIKKRKLMWEEEDSKIVTEGNSEAKLERRRAEKALSRQRKSVCFHCRKPGHLLSNCPNRTENENTSTGICYKCGSTEHSAFKCKAIKDSSFQFAQCFICKEEGHIARQCPDNPRGLYPQGGACRECGDVTHLRRDCPKIVAQKAEEVVTVGVRNDRNLECLDEEIVNFNKEKQNVKKVKKNSTVKF